jgi:hypothetical protein
VSFFKVSIPRRTRILRREKSAIVQQGASRFISHFEDFSMTGYNVVGVGDNLASHLPLFTGESGKIAPDLFVLDIFPGNERIS